jgi:molybdopterin molybdotransferase
MDMITMDEAIRVVLQHTSEIDRTNVDLMDALGCTLAEDVRSDIDMPPFDKATMDGYAVVGADVADARQENPAVLEVIEEIPAGSVPKKTVSPGQAARIMTGAPMPDGADTVVMVEETVSEREGDGVRVLAPTEPGRNVVPLGEDIRRNQVVLEDGTWIRPPEIGILAAVGMVSVPVYRRPVIGVAATGSEIVEPGNDPAAGQIRNSNGYSMMAQALRSGAETRYLGIVEDDEAALNAVISRGLDECDVVLLSGGVSAGIYDLVQGAMRDCGVEIFFDRIRMKPGKPLTFGARGEKLVFGLPGNPVSAVVGLELLVRPAVRKMQRMCELHRPMVRGRLAQAFRQSPGRKQFVPARSREVNGCWESRWVGHHGSADLFSLSRANSLFVVEAEVEALEAGSEVDIVLLEEW